MDLKANRAPMACFSSFMLSFLQTRQEAKMDLARLCALGIQHIVLAIAMQSLRSSWWHWSRMR